MINASEYAFKPHTPAVRCTHCGQEVDALPRTEFRAFCSESCMLAAAHPKSERARAYRYDGPLK